jgi:hypothetical protein
MKSQVAAAVESDRIVGSPSTYRALPLVANRPDAQRRTRGNFASAFAGLSVLEPVASLLSLSFDPRCESFLSGPPSKSYSLRLKNRSDTMSPRSDLYEGGCD